MKLAICDDEWEGIQQLRQYIEQTDFSKDMDIREYTPSELLFDLGEDFFDCEIILMDIYYDGMDFNGIHVASQINQSYPLCKVIFVSNYVEYAESVYDTNHIFFIRKEHARQLLGKALHKAIQAIKEKNTDILALRSEGRRIFLQSKEILYVSREVQRYILVHTQNGKYKSMMSLNELSKMTDELGIIRIHGSFLVNLAHIEQYLPDQVVLSDGTILPIGRTYASRFKKRYLSFWGERL